MGETLRALFRACLPYLIGAALLALIGIAAWRWVTGLGNEARVKVAQMQLLEAHGELAACKATAASRRAQIEAQNSATKRARAEGEARRKAALAARDEALGALEATQARYNRLSETWPSGCVEAVQRIRDEYGL